MLGMRTAYNFGAPLVGADIDGMNLGNGPLNPRPNVLPSFIASTTTFSSILDITIAGVAMKLTHVPSAAADQVAVFLPQTGILLSSELIPAQHFPALHTLRGEAFRSPADWYQSIDALRRFRASAMVPSHGVPVVGAAAVDEVMRNYRDAIQYVHDQTIRGINKGLTPDELAHAVKLPPHLAGYKPWMQEFFGSVRQAVRGIYQGYLGWFEGDPVALTPVPRAESARREVALMGGRDRVLTVAQQFFDDGDPQWAAELASRLIRIDRDDMTARRLKAASAAASRRVGRPSQGAAAIRQSPCREPAVSSGCSPTWLPTFTRRGLSVTTPHGAAIGSRRNARGSRRWPTSWSRPRWCSASPIGRCSSSAAPAIARTSRSNASGARFAPTGFWKAPRKSCAIIVATRCAIRRART